MSESAGAPASRQSTRCWRIGRTKVGLDFSAATRCLAAWRGVLAQRWRHSAAEADRLSLERVNAAISVILGGQFPLDHVPWQEIERVRQDLGELADQSLDGGRQSSHTTRS